MSQRRSIELYACTSESVGVFSKESRRGLKGRVPIAPNSFANKPGGNHVAKTVLFNVSANSGRRLDRSRFVQKLSGSEFAGWPVGITRGSHAHTRGPLKYHRRW